MYSDHGKDVVMRAKYAYLTTRFPNPSHAWVFPSILACTGFFVGTISPIISADKASWNIGSSLGSNKSYGVLQVPNVMDFAKIWRDVYDHCRDVLGPLMKEKSRRPYDDGRTDAEQKPSLLDLGKILGLLAQPLPMMNPRDLRKRKR
jgi:hypothetical protein